MRVFQSKCERARAQAATTPCAPFRTKIVINYYGFTFIDVLKPYLDVRYGMTFMTVTFVCLTSNCHKHLFSPHTLYTWQIATTCLTFAPFSKCIFFSLSLSLALSRPNVYLFAITHFHLVVCHFAHQTIRLLFVLPLPQPSSPPLASRFWHTQKYHN